MKEMEQRKHPTNILAVLVGRQTDKICCHIDKSYSIFNINLKNKTIITFE